MGKGIAAITLAATAMVGTAGVASASTPATPHGGGLVNVVAKNILNGNETNVLNNVQIPVAAALCAIDVNVLTKQLQKGKADCPALSNAKQLAWVENAG
jgi:hypothetical protein